MDRSIARSCVVGIALLTLSASTAAVSLAQPTGPPLAAVDPGDVDARLDSGERYWAGQTVFFDGSTVVADVEDASVADRTFEVHTVADGDRVGTFVREFVVDTDGERALDTSTLDRGEYVVLYRGQVVYAQDGTGYTAAPPDGTPVTVGTSAWSVAEQTISASWSDDRVFRTDVVELEVRSNRAGFRIEVSADRLDFDDLESMFDPGDFAADHDAKASEDVLILAISGDVAALSVGFRDIDNGEYTLEIEVPDSTARTTTTVRVGRAPPTGPTPVRTETPTATPVRTEPPAATPTPVPTASPEPTPSPTPPSRTAIPRTERPTASPGQPSATPSPSPTESPGQPGFAAWAAVVAVAIALLAFRRRRA